MNIGCVEVVISLRKAVWLKVSLSLSPLVLSASWIAHNHDESQQRRSKVK